MASKASSSEGDKLPSSSLKRTKIYLVPEPKVVPFKPFAILNSS